MAPGSPSIRMGEARSALQPTGGYLGRFTHSFNPAIGCVYAGGTCGGYCYARSFAERTLGKGTWGETVVVKGNAPDLLRAELERASRRDPEHRHHVSRISVFSSSTTDPCAPPILELYRACLRVVAEFPIRRWVVQTRSPAVVRLARELEALGSRAAISFTVESDDERFDRLLGSGSPTLRARRRAAEEMRGWSVPLHLAIAPFLPCLDPPRFADWIAAQADTATVDTFVSGDGAGGRRSARGSLVAAFEDEGLDWRDESAARELHRLLRERVGAAVGWSDEGFNRLA